MFGKRRDRDGNRLLGPDERSPKLGLRIKDLQVLQRLHKVGADLTQPRHVRYYLYFPSEAAAKAALPEAQQTGLDVDLRVPPDARADKWSMICEGHDIVLHPDFVRWIDDQMQAIADRHDAEYDGWEAAVQADEPAP